MKFDPEHKKILDSPSRKKITPPFKILRMLGLKRGMTFVDVGAGTGFFSIPASKIVGDSGKVIALDIEEKMLKEIRKKVRQGRINNIIIKKSKEYQFPIESKIADFAFISNVLHEIDNKVVFLKEVWRILKKEAFLGILEWKKVKTPQGPPLAIRLSKNDIEHFVKEAGFILKTDRGLKKNFNIFLCLKRGS